MRVSNDCIPTWYRDRPGPDGLPGSFVWPPGCAATSAPGTSIAARLASLESTIAGALGRVASRLGASVCAHPHLVRAAFEAPVAALVAGLVAECPECAVVAAGLGQRLVDSAVTDVERRCVTRAPR
jgi:hypothetical protein